MLGPPVSRACHLLLEGTGRALEPFATPRRSSAASRGHIQRQRNTSPLTMLKASLRGRCGRGPEHVLGEQAGVRHVGQAVPLRLGCRGRRTAGRSPCRWSPARRGSDPCSWRCPPHARSPCARGARPREALRRRPRRRVRPPARSRSSARRQPRLLLVEGRVAASRPCA